MSMDGTFIDSLAEQMRGPSVLAVEDGARLVVPKGWVELERKRPSPEPLKVHTLTALVDYVKRNVDGLDLAACLLHVKDPNTVLLRAKLEDEAQDFRRRAYAVATTELTGTGFPFGQYHDAETFFIGLQTGFMESPEREDLLTLVASIREHTVRETVDDRVAQEVKTGKGVALVGMTKVPNPVTLRPFRTFREVTQPSSPFVLRMQSGQEGGRPKVALFEADGGAWKLTAIQTVADALRHDLGETVAILA